MLPAPPSPFPLSPTRLLILSSPPRDDDRYIGQIYTVPKYTKKDIKKEIYNFLWNSKKIRPPRHLAQLSSWKGGVGSLYIDNELHSSKIKWIQSLSNPTNALWKNLTLYQLNLILNSNHGLAL